MDDPTLFPLGAPLPVPAEVPPVAAKLRLLRADRDQVEIHYEHLDAMLPDEHPARIVWGFVEASDLSSLTSKIRAAEDRPGRAAIDPKVLLALWLQATLDGIGSARALEKLCDEHLVYRWIRGGVPVNYHTLADFRSELGECLDELLSDMVATLLSKQVVTLRHVAVDGVRVRAHAARGSFRRGETLERFIHEAEAQVRALKTELHADPAASDNRRKAAKQRAAEERLARVREALAQLPDIKKKKKDPRKQARASTTDADARSMRMADGGSHPGYNLQVTTDPATQVVLDVDVSQSGSDAGLLKPAYERLRRRHPQPIEAMLADGGYTKKKDIEALGSAGCTVYTPVPKHRRVAQRTRRRKEREDGPHTAAWRVRMATEAAKEKYRLRCQTECVHAQFRNRGLYQIPLRGLKKVRTILLLHAVAQNVMRMTALLKQAA